MFAIPSLVVFLATLYTQAAVGQLAVRLWRPFKQKLMLPHHSRVIATRSEGKRPGLDALSSAQMSIRVCKRIVCQHQEISLRTTRTYYYT